MKPSELVGRFETQISEMRNSGKSWGDIAEKLCFETGETVSSLSLKVAFNRRSSQSTVDETPAKNVSKREKKQADRKVETPAETPQNVDQELMFAIEAATQKINELKDEIDTLKKYNNELQINNKELQESNSELNHKLDNAIIENLNGKECIKSTISQSNMQVDVYKRKIGELSDEINMLKKNIENNI
jgi:predicted RNase H-like nuclease (RuvC/YqgF family)